LTLSKNLIFIAFLASKPGSAQTVFEAIKSMLGLRPRAPKQLSEGERAKLLLYLEEYLEEGFAKALPASSVREDVWDALSGELPDDDLSAAIDARVPVLEDARRAEMASWPKVTDCDRLDAAFAELQSAGLIAEQNYWCCQSCGYSDARATIKQARKAGGAVPRGYVFYHEQDTDNALHGGGLFLAYGSSEGRDAACRAVAAEVIKALKDHGLEPEWDGKLSSRIFLPLDWKRRTPLRKFY
jgi:hypothetical protein